MTTVQEIHIAINLGIKGINPKIYDSYGDERKDFLFNTIMFSTVKEKIDSLLAVESEKPEGIFYTDLGLLRKSVKIKAYYDILSGGYYCVLPDDYLGIDIKKIGADVNYKLPSFQKEEQFPYVRYAALPLEEDPNTFEDFKIFLSVTDPNFSGLLFNVDNYPTLNIETNEQRFYLTNLILEDAKTTGILSNINISVYWERYNNLYIPNNIIFVSNISNVDSIKFSYKNNVVIKDFSTLSFLSYTGNGIKMDSQVRLINAGDLAIKNDPFGKTHYESPLGEIKEGTVFVYGNNTFVVENIILTYYRKPRLIDYTLGRNCELSSSFTQEIINKTISFIKSTTEAGKINEVINK